MPITPTQRSLKFLRDQGFTVHIVEKWIPTTPLGYKGKIIRCDVWGFGDILATKVGQIGATLVQTTSGAHVADHITKIKGIAEAGIWLASGNRIVVHGWAKRGERGKRKLWDCRVVEVRFD
jgi:hypothetical protein